MFLLLGLFGAMLGGAAAASSNWPETPSRLVFDTPYGTLQVKNNEYLYESRLHFNDTDVAPVIEGLLNIPYAFSLPAAQVALVSINSGNTDCPVSYRWVVLTKKGYTISPSFGSCSEQIKVTVKGRSFLVQTPSTQMPDKIDVYAYDGKTVSKRTQRQ
ncbi:MAG TPA: hypothetical protein VL003_01085 [Pusillimonas sp.]|uniref:hypothetical protein n=1 Tax=Pusillimonas sp. TaxID=3040095 RepID=UPI002CE7DDF9|nr:hypothetical protein [Pusillimonas sp.]HUH86630.1 hypothetical protein [Pusillimonas sp.]